MPGRQQRSAHKLTGDDEDLPRQSSSKHLSAFWLVKSIPAATDDDVAQVDYTFESVNVPTEKLPVSSKDGWAIAGYSDTAVVARVLSWKRTRSIGGVLWSEFNIETLRTLKGDSSQQHSTLEAMGGFGPDGKYYGHASDSPLLPGQAYIFWAKGAADSGAPRVIPGVGTQPISRNEALHAQANPAPRHIADAANSVANETSYTGS